MSVLAFRRYLQPSPTLRWHPWAPLLALVLALAMALAAGCVLGYRFAQQNHAAEADVLVFFRAMNRVDENAGKYLGVMREADEIDRVVLRYVAAQGANTFSVASIARRLVGGKADTRPMVRRLAEYRLAELSGSAPRWLLTAGYCARLGAPSTGEDLTSRYERAARAYSVVLSRPVQPIELAPAVPGGRCEGGSLSAR